MIGNIICNNIAAGGNVANDKKCGGGISFEMPTQHKHQLINCLIYNNYALERGGGIDISKFFPDEGANVAITNCIITKNDSPLASGIYCNSNTNVEIENSIVYNNRNSEVFHEIDIPTIRYSDIKGGFEGIGNIDSDPFFNDPGKNDYHLQYISPCRNAGNNNAIYLPEYDFEGDPRIYFGKVDMGADEFHPHLYSTGDAVPSGNVDLQIVGIPRANPVGLFLSQGILDPPLPSAYGDWYLDFPISLFKILTYIPMNGVLEVPVNIPSNPKDEYYLQAFIQDLLTNACTIKIEK